MCTNQWEFQTATRTLSTVRYLSNYFGDTPVNEIRPIQICDMINEPAAENPDIYYMYLWVCILCKNNIPCERKKTLTGNSFYFSFFNVNYTKLIMNEEFFILSNYSKQIENCKNIYLLIFQTMPAVHFSAHRVSHPSGISPVRPRM